MHGHFGGAPSLSMGAVWAPFCETDLKRLRETAENGTRDGCVLPSGIGINKRCPLDDVSAWWGENEQVQG